MKTPAFANSTASSVDSLESVGRPGIATGWLAKSVMGASDWKQTAVEKLSNRYHVASFDFDQGRLSEKKIKQRVEHTGQEILSLGYKEDWRRGTPEENIIFSLLLSESQEVWAADGRDAPARWIKARDLVPGRHVLRLAYAQDPWAELVRAEAPHQEKYQNLTVHELILIEGDSCVVNNVLCRTACVPAAPPVKKRVVYPLKDFPLINFVPQPKTLLLAHAEVWYRKSAALLPRCVGESPEPVARVRALLELKRRMREVAAKAAIDPTLRDEFIATHPLPTLEELLPDHAQLAPEALKRAIETAVQMLSAPGNRRYSAFTGGMESHHVQTGYAYWKFDGTQWLQTTTQDK